MAKSIINYFGNKYPETKKNINLYPDFSKYKTIVEPFGGSFGFSRYLYEKNKDLSFIICDTNKDLIDFYNFIKNNTDEQNEAFINEYNEIQKTFELLRPEESKAFLKNKPIVETINKIENKYLRFLLFNNIVDGKIYFKTSIKKKLDLSIFNKCEFLNINFNDLDLSTYDKATTLIYLDPPYFSETNKSYDNKTFTNIFENMLKCFETYNTILIVILNPMVDYIFKKYKFNEYKKRYGLTNKEVNHVIYYSLYNFA